ncbi:hypothetical protein BCD67_03195 [Oscillatoriales cyanobacterium USR001]|nr:hypothetical protein BCD67_03195 [Oscillatoriales cyanobacterium USR001]
MKRQALVVGINRYPFLKGENGKTLNLTNAAGDAEAIAQLLEKASGDLAWSVKRLPEIAQDDRFKIDGRATVIQEDLSEAILETFNPQPPHIPDVALLFFAGHGLRQQEDGKFEGFLATSEVTPRKNRWGVSLNWLREVLIKSPVKQQIIWLDCCHSGEVLNFLTEEELKDWLSGGDRLLVAACRGDREAYALGDRGVLTEVLLQGLNPLQYPSGDWITSWTLAEFIEKQLKANPLLKRQIPLSRQFGEKIYFWQGMKQGVRHNLPQPDYGHFIGREQELGKVISLLSHSRSYMITIDGIGGIGKSALALEVAHRFRRDYKNIPIEKRFEAIIWTSAKRTTLRADRGIVNRQQKLQTLDDICKTIAITLGIEESVRSQPEERFELVCRELTKQPTLLILDNLETVDDEAVMEFLQDLLPEPTKAIVTTRHRINVAYPVRLSAMPWEDAEKLIEQECQRKEVMLTDEQKRKLYDRTGGVPLAIVWTVAKIGFGSSVDTVLAKLGSPKNDIARFCFEETVEKIKHKDSYKLLLSLALFKTEATRKELGYVAGFGEDEFSCDDGLEELQKLSLLNKEGDKFSMLPLTKEYITQELEIPSELTAEAISRLINYTSQNPNLAVEYMDYLAGSSDNNDLYTAWKYGIG